MGRYKIRLDLETTYSFESSKSPFGRDSRDLKARIESGGVFDFPYDLRKGDVLSLVAPDKTQYEFPVDEVKHIIDPSASDNPGNWYSQISLRQHGGHPGSRAEAQKMLDEMLENYAFIKNLR